MQIRTNNLWEQRYWIFISTWDVVENDLLIFRVSSVKEHSPRSITACQHVFSKLQLVLYVYLLPLWSSSFKKLHMVQLGTAVPWSWRSSVLNYSLVHSPPLQIFSPPTIYRRLLLQLVGKSSTNPRLGGSIPGSPDSYPHVKVSLDYTLNPKALALMQLPVSNNFAKRIHKM